MRTGGSEDWGLTVLEAAGWGKTCVAVASGGPRESVVDGETGLLVEPSPEAMAAALQRLAEAPEEAAAMGAAARARCA